MLDLKDIQIIRQLQKDARCTLKELADKINFTSMGAKKRLDKLLKNKIVKTSALLNIEKLKFIPVVVFIEAISGEVIRKILSQFKDCPRIIKFFTTIGGDYNLIA